MSFNPNHPLATTKNQTPPRLLALDYGERRVGIAMSDELGMLAHPRPAIVGASRQELLAAIRDLVAAESVGEVIVGMPLSLSGEAGHQAREVRTFVRELRHSIDVPVTEADERLSSRAAEESLKGRERKRSGQRDSAAAALVLQSVLDARRQESRT